MVAGRDNPRQAGLCCAPVLSFPPTRKSTARLGSSHQRRPARYLTAACASTRSTQHAARSTDLVTGPTAPGIPISSLSISYQRSGRNDARLGKAPAENNKRCRDGCGFAAGIGMSSRPRPCPPPSLPLQSHGLWSQASGLVFSVCLLLRPISSACSATTSHLVFETLGSGAAVWTQLGIQTPCQCQVVAPTPRLAHCCPASISRTGAETVGGLLWRAVMAATQTQIGTRSLVATAPLSKVLTHFQGPKSIIAMTPATRRLQSPVAFPLIMLRCRTGEEFRRPRVGPGQGGVGNRTRILQSGPLPTSWSQFPRELASLSSPSSFWL